MRRRSPRRAVLIFALLLSACSTDSCGCDGFEQRAFPTTKLDVTIPAAGQARVSPAGLDYVESQVPYLLEQFMPGGLSFCIPPDTSGNPDLCIDSTCANGQSGCQVDLELADHELRPVPTDTLEARIVIGDVDEALPFDYDTGLFTANCTAKLHKSGASKETPATVSGVLPLRVFVDQADDQKAVGVDVGQWELDLSDVDFNLDGRGNFGDTLACEGASLVRGLYRGMVEDEIRNALGDVIEGLRRTQLCRQCGSSADCPSSASCASDGVCEYSADDCVPRTLGIEGRLDVGGLLSGFLRDDSVRIDAMAKGADLARVDDGVTAGLRAGFEPVGASECVPVVESERPPIANVNPSPTITGDTRPGGGSFMMAVGVHRSAIEQALWSLWASGASCLEISDREVMVLNTTAFTLVAPSMKDLARGGESAVLSVVANRYPTVELGANTIRPDGESYVIEEPLLRILWEDVDFHVFAYAQSRYTRMFTLRVDLDIPVALVPDGAGNLLTVIPDLEEAIAEIEPRRLELLTEDADSIRDVVPTLISLAAPQLAGAIPEAIEIPTFIGFRLDLTDGDITAVDGGEFVGVFADLARTNQPLRAVANTAIVSEHVSYDRVLDSGFVRPEVTLDVRGYAATPFEASTGEYEFSWRVDGGFWSLYTRTDPLVVDDPALAIQGEHLIEVRARELGAHATADPEPARTVVRIDWQDPHVTARRVDGKLRLEGEDLGDEELEFRVRAVDGTWTRWSGRSEIDPRELGLAGLIEVQARDDAGRTAQTTARIPERAPSAPKPSPAPDTTPPTSGCSAAGSPGACGWAVVLFLFVVGAGRRRRRLPIRAILTGLALILASCGGCRGELRTNADQRCFGAGCDVDQDCEVDGDCTGICPKGNGGICESGACQCVKACQSGCGEDSFCCLSTAECQPFGKVCGDLACDPGFEAGVAEFTPNRQTCELEDVDCACQPLPPLPMGWHGRYASIDSDGDLTVVATYNEEYGDLMLGRVKAGGEIDWYAVAGVPDDAMIEGDPSGPRGGVAAKGADVGTHTAVAIDASGAVHVFYRDEDAEQLRWGRATFSDDGRPAFDSIVLDEEATAVWPSAAASGDTIHVAWVVEEAGDPPRSELRHAAIPADADLAPPLRTTLVSADAVDQPKGYPVRVAAFPDLSATDSGAFLTFWNGGTDRVGRMQYDGAAWTEPTYIAGGTGPWTAGAVGADGLEHVVFQLSQGLRYSRFGDVQTGLVDDGRRDFADEYFSGAVGEDSALRVDGSTVTVAYQDAFDRTLVVASSTNGTDWDVERRGVDGAGSGFWVAGTRRGARWVADFVVDRNAEPAGYLRVTPFE